MSALWVIERKVSQDQAASADARIRRPTILMADRERAAVDGCGLDCDAELPYEAAMADVDDIPEVAPERAYELMQDDPSALLLDVRSEMEFLMIGHPTGAVNIAWIDGPDWVVNPAFATQVRRLMLGRLSGAARRRAAIFLICRSGNRSLDAARHLREHDLGDVYVIAGGFEGPLDDEHHRNTIAGWRFAGLPWEQC